MNIFEKIIFRKNYLFSRTKYNYMSLSFAQEGEDKILDDYFGYKESGFYVEVGAHHPQRFSNSYLFYLKGWNGINIDAWPGSMKPFKKVRSRDVNLEIGVSDRPGELPFFIFNEAALNTFDPDIAEQRVMVDKKLLLNKVSVSLERLSTILNRHLPDGVDIDFLSIDVEGYDLNVLLSNDWVKYSPKVVLVEDNNNSNTKNSPISKFMESVGYSLFARTNRNSLFKKIS